MATEFTPHYNLDKYTAQDKPNLRDQYNAAMDKIDLALLSANTDAAEAKSATQGFQEQLNAKATKTEVAEDIADAVEPLATKTELNNAVSPLATKTELNNAVSPLATKTELSNAIAPLATKTELNNAKQDTDALISELNSKVDENLFAFNNVAEMKNSGYLSGGVICRTNGFYSDGDGGAAYYKISDTGTANEYDCIKCGNHYANLIYMPTMSIEMLGGKNDGSADVSTYFNAIISKNVSCIQLFGNKLYTVSSNVNLKQNFAIIGTSRSATILLANNAQIILPPNSESNYALYLHNFTLRCNGARNSYALELNDMVYSVLNNVLIRSDDGASKYNGCIIQRNTASNEAFANVVAFCTTSRATFNFKNSTDNFIVFNKFWGNSLNADAVTFEGNCSNTLIQGNHIIASAEHVGLHCISAIKNMRIVNNYSDVSNYGFRFESINKSIIKDNLFFENGIEPLALNYSNSCVIEGNIFDNCCNDSAGKGDIYLISDAYANVIKANIHERTGATYSTPTPPVNISASNPITSVPNLIKDLMLYQWTNYSTISSKDGYVFKDSYPPEYFPN